MAQHRPPDTFDDLPLIVTPVIDLQDLERKRGRNTRASHYGEKIEPTINDDTLGFSDDDEAVLAALEEFERSIRQQSPG